MAAAAGALVEVLLLSAAHDHIYVRARRAEQGRTAPDAVARALAGITPREAQRVLHSTSWRFDGSRIVLTYVALPDPVGPAGARRLVARDLARGLSATSPAPVRLSLDEVAAHACRHLAFLRATDPTVAEAARGATRIWDLIEAMFAPAVAGALPAR